MLLKCASSLCSIRATGPSAPTASRPASTGLCSGPAIWSRCEKARRNRKDARLGGAFVVDGVELLVEVAGLVSNPEREECLKQATPECGA